MQAVRRRGCSRPRLASVALSARAHGRPARPRIERPGGLGIEAGSVRAVERSTPALVAGALWDCATSPVAAI
ncbi:MAG: hypothetical protein NZ555_17045, partial [Geminicoccaceae bacterium]|nr:hypothetical protein [Geminicoccaceae bacterium]